MTAEELEALPENGVDRELIRGQLREKPMTMRNKDHSAAIILLGHYLMGWLERQPEPRGRIVGGEAGFVLSRNPDTSVGIDVAYVSPEVIARTPKSAAFFEGPPILAVEIVSKSETEGDLDEKIDLYQESGVQLVWIVNPKRRTVLAFARGEEPVLFNVRQELSGEPHLPGFRVPVAEIFQI
jgi:Uma2 family endonuclease